MGKQWKIGVERLENWLQREENLWKQWGAGRMMPGHVKHAWNIGKAMGKWQFWCVTTRRTERKPWKKDDWVKLEEKLWKKHWGDWNEGKNDVE